MVVTGTIFKVERFALHDGPGIRTAVFLKGCPLRCSWCSSPESQNPFPEMVYKSDRCLGCQKCASVCPVGAIPTDRGKITTLREICNNCGKCTVICSAAARTMVGQETTVEEAMKYIENDAIFYYNSGGGVTLSGGEPTMQPEFSIGLLKGCHKVGIHTSMETCGFAEWCIFEEMLGYLDLMYVDIKHMLNTKHMDYCGVGNELILENIKKIAATCGNTSLILRIPVIPNYNDSVENISDIAKFIQGLPRVYRVELLPYHRLGTFMYRALHREYVLQDLKVPNPAHLSGLKQLIESLGIPCQVGG